MNTPESRGGRVARNTHPDREADAWAGARTRIGNRTRGPGEGAHYAAWASYIFDPENGNVVRSTKNTFAGRSASRRMYHGYQAVP